jgi:hypothetical protein
MGSNPFGSIHRNLHQRLRDSIPSGIKRETSGPTRSALGAFPVSFAQRLDLEKRNSNGQRTHAIGPGMLRRRRPIFLTVR